MTNKEHKEILNFMGLLGITFPRKTKATFKKYLKHALTIVYNEGKAEGLNQARRIFK